MTKFTKLAAGTLAALTLTAGVLAAPTEAKAWKGGGFGWGPAIGLGIAGGVLAGAAYAATAPGYGYYVGAPAGCRWVARYDNWGNYRGSVKVCDLY
jgi:hypothetical protein